MVRGLVLHRSTAAPSWHPDPPRARREYLRRRATSRPHRRLVLPPSGPASLLRLNPPEDVGAVIPHVASEPDAGEQAAARVLANPANRHGEQVRDLVGG